MIRPSYTIWISNRTGLSENLNVSLLGSIASSSIIVHPFKLDKSSYLLFNFATL